MAWILGRFCKMLKCSDICFFIYLKLSRRHRYQWSNRYYCTLRILITIYYKKQSKFDWLFITLSRRNRQTDVDDFWYRETIIPMLLFCENKSVTLAKPATSQLVPSRFFNLSKNLKTTGYKWRFSKTKSWRNYHHLFSYIFFLFFFLIGNVTSWEVAG